MMDFTPTYRIPLGDVDCFRILLVGCGGTGSALALALGGLAYHAWQKGTPMELTLVDHDVIEERNVGRQSFPTGAATSGDRAKSSDLALRLNAAYGLGVTAWPRPYSHDLGRRWFHGGRNGQTACRVMVDCVDNYRARREMARLLAEQDGRLWLLSCGNDRTSGQVLLGNTTRPAEIEFDRMGLCTTLPAPYVQEPGLLEPETAASEPPLSCAQRTQIEEQSLMVNRMAATIAAQFVTKMVTGRQVTQMAAYFNLSPTVMTPRLITETAMVEVLDRPDGLE